MEITYQLTKKQDFFQKNINSFVEQKIKPLAEEIDKKSEFPQEVMDQLAGNRLLGLLLPSKEGGEGAGFLDFCLALEGIGKICPTSALICSVQNLGTRLLYKYGTPDQKGEYLPRLIEGEAVFGYTLPEVVSLDLADVLLSFSKGSSLNDGYLLNGSGCYVVNGDAAELICVFAKNEQLLSCFLIEKDTPGLNVVRTDGMTGAEARCTVKATLENCHLSIHNLMGEEGEGHEIMANMINEASCFTAARAVGIAQGALGYAIQYAKGREQFGRQIGSFQAIQVLLAGMATQVEAARHLVYKAAAVLELKSKDSHKFSAIAKFFASKMAMEVTTNAVQILGGYGLMKEYPLEKMMRNAQLTQISEGGNHSQQLAIAKYMFGDTGK